MNDKVNIEQSMTDYVEDVGSAGWYANKLSSDEYDYPPTEEELQWLRDKERDYTIDTYFNQLRKDHWYIIKYCSESYVELIEKESESYQINLNGFNSTDTMKLAMELSQRGFNYTIYNDVIALSCDDNGNDTHVKHVVTMFVTISYRTPTIIPKKFTTPDGDVNGHEYKMAYILGCLDLMGANDQWDTIFMDGMHTRASTEDRLRGMGQKTYSHGMSYDDRHKLRVQRILNTERVV